MILMCMDGGLEGLKTENVEKALVLQWFLDLRVAPGDRLIEQCGGVGRG